MTSPEHNTFPPDSAAHHGMAHCHHCQGLRKVHDEHCVECGNPLHLRKPQSLYRTLALLVASVVLYIPANIYPIMASTSFGVMEANSIIAGVILFFSQGSYLVASVIFVASVIVPIAKMVSLSWLCFSVMRPNTLKQQELTRLFMVVEIIGKWSMIDVFVVATMVATVQMGTVMSITPGLASSAFAGVVILTMLAAHEFDPRLLWDKLENPDAKP